MAKTINKLFKIEDDIYQSCLGLYIGKKEKFNEYLKNLGIPEDMYANGIGKCIMYNGINLIWIPSINGYQAMGNLIHELHHFACNLFDERGIPITVENDEAMAYYKGMIFRNILKKLKIKITQ